MWETIWVQGVEYPKDHKNYPCHSSMPGGPLVMHDGAWIGWKRMGLTKPEKWPDGSLRERLTFRMGENGKGEQVRQPVMFKFVYDPRPVQVALKSTNSHISDAIKAGDLKKISAAEAKKLLKGGE